MIKLQNIVQSIQEMNGSIPLNSYTTELRTGNKNEETL